MKESGVDLPLGHLPVNPVILTTEFSFFVISWKTMIDIWILRVLRFDELVTKTFSASNSIRLSSYFSH